MRIIALLFAFMLTGMRREPVGRRNEANCRRPERPTHGRNVRRYCDGGHGDHTHGRDCRGTISQRSR
jgi:hypothetical protein